MTDSAQMQRKVLVGTNLRHVLCMNKNTTQMMGNCMAVEVNVPSAYSLMPNEISQTFA